MKVLVEKKYMKVPLGFHAVNKKIYFHEGSKLVFDLDAAVDIVSPDYHEYVDVSRFIGKDITVCCDMDLNYNFEFVNTPPAPDISDRFRPLVHFSSNSGWINDPNGLVFSNGMYHMFFQHNTVGNKWGNMHWGHAVSSDLIHWTQKDEALYPDELGTMFSGSAIIDKDNVSDLGSNENPAMLLYYTAAGGTSKISEQKMFTQCLAYSTDNGETFEKHEKNPIVPHIIDGNRDPKIIYCDELKAYIMALYLTENKYALLTSKDLVNWEQIDEFALNGDAECPDIYPLAVDGYAQNIKWVFSGATDYYCVGSFKKGRFVPEGAPKRLHYGSASYAAQTFSDTEELGRRIRIAWNRTEIPSSRFNGSMAFPTDMTLKTINGEEYLCAMPIPEIETLRKGEQKYLNEIAEKDNAFSAVLDGKAYDISLDITANGVNFKISLFGLEFEFKVKENLMQVQNHSVPLFVDSGKIKLRIITDIHGAEVFIDKGQAFICIGFIMDYNLNKLKLSSQNGDVQINEMKIFELKEV